MKNSFSEIKLSYNPIKFAKIQSSRDIEQFLRLNWDNDTMHFCEEFKVLLLNNSLEIIGFRTISRGGITFSPVDVRILFSLALKSLSTAIIVAHNHPSGKLLPSQQDRDMTSKIKEGCKILDIQLIDHLILSPEGGYFSFADEGFL